MRHLLNWLMIIASYAGVTGSAHGADEPKTSSIELAAEQKDEFSFVLCGRRLILQAGSKLSRLLEAAGDPDDFDQFSHIGHYMNYLYGWGLDSDAGPSLIIEGNREEDTLIDWAVVWYQDGKKQKMICFRYRGKSRTPLSERLDAMRLARKAGRPTCPGCRWCTTFNRSQEHGGPFEILMERDVVGPSLWVNLQFAGLPPETIPGDIGKRSFLTVETPSGKTYTGAIKVPEALPGRILRRHEMVQFSAPFFFWVSPDMANSDVPIGRYRYYATVLGARSRTAEVIVHRIAIVIPSPNEEDKEIVITPFYDRIPIHGLRYPDLRKECETRFGDIFDGEPQDVLIPAYRFTECVAPEGSQAFRKEREVFPLRDFGTVYVRKRDNPGRIRKRTED